MQLNCRVTLLSNLLVERIAATLGGSLAVLCRTPQVRANQYAVTQNADSPPRPERPGKGSGRGCNNDSEQRAPQRKGHIQVSVIRTCIY